MTDIKSGLTIYSPKIHVSFQHFDASGGRAIFSIGTNETSQISLHMDVRLSKMLADACNDVLKEYEEMTKDE